jgi:YbgC/YbaW family acyl-CoA thioester hydrolase
VSDEAAHIFSAPRTVRFQDVDAAGILFFARAFEYFHDAYMDCLAARGVDLPRAIREGAWGAPIAHAEADYKAPMRHGDPVVVDIERALVGRSSLTTFYRVRSPAGDHTYCTGRMVSVFVDRATRKPCDVVPEVCAAFTEKGEAPA